MMVFFKSADEYLKSSLAKEPSPKLFLLAEHSAADIISLQQSALKNNTEIYGAVFPALLKGGVQLSGGLLVKPVEKAFFLGHDTSIEDLLNVKNAMGSAYKSAYLFIDGLSASIDYLLQGISSVFGESLSVFGGGAGFSDFMARPVLFDKQKWYQNAALLAPVKGESFNQAGHGWESTGEVMVANETEANRFQELNWKNAFETYKQKIQDIQKQKLTPDNFFDIAKTAPLGIFQKDEEYVIRDLIATNDKQELITTIDVNKNAVFELMTGNKDNLLKASETIAKQNIERARHFSFDNYFICDCITRTQVLNKAFNEELSTLNENAIKVTGSELTGILTIGEIITGLTRKITFNNKAIITNLIRHERF